MVNLTINDQLLAELNDQTVVLMIPVIVYVSVLMILGTVGNIMVWVYFGCKSRPSTNSFFIVALASFDLMLCAVTMPIEIVDLRFFYMFTNVPACKISRLLNHIAADGSATTLIVIAIDRYKRVCKPMSPQLHTRHARIAIIIAITFALVIAWPAVVFYEPVNVNVTDPNNETIILQGLDCTTTKSEDYRTYLLVFNSIQFLIYIISISMLCVLYSLICRSIYRYKGRRLKYASTRRTTYESSNESENGSKPGSISSEASIQTIETVAEKVEKTKDVKHNGSTRMKETSQSFTKKPLSVSRKSISNAKEKEKTPDIKTVKVTIMMLVITVVYVVGYLPYLVLVIWRIFQSGYEGDILSDSELVAFQIGIRSYLLNSAINPILYVFFNETFRRFFFATFCPCCTKKREPLTSSTSIMR